MPHFKCVACRTRLHGTSILAELVGDLCPECGGRLTPAGDLSELMGFRLVTPQVAMDGAWSDGGGSLVADAVAMPRPEAGP